METSDFLDEACKHYEEAAKLTEDEIHQRIIAFMGKSTYFLSDLYRLFHGLTTDTNILFDTIEKLPKGAEFDELKVQLEKAKKDRDEITIQIPKEIEKELKEWLSERERAKKAQGQYVQ